MTPEQFRGFVEQVKLDGKLTSVPLAFQREDGEIELISGHHRTLVAIEAGLEKIQVEVIVTGIDEDRIKSLQLSHNARTGQDNPSILAQIWATMSLDAKKFSGLTEDSLGKYLDIKIEGLGAAALKYDEVSLMFLPLDRAIFEEALGKLKDSPTKIPRIHMAAAEDFTKFFDTVVAVKERKGVNNSALAIVTMAELAMERLAQIEAEEAEAKQAEEAQEQKPAKGKRK